MIICIKIFCGFVSLRLWHNIRLIADSLSDHFHEWPANIFYLAVEIWFSTQAFDQLFFPRGISQEFSNFHYTTQWELINQWLIFMRMLLMCKEPTRKQDGMTRDESGQKCEFVIWIQRGNQRSQSCRKKCMQSCNRPANIFLSKCLQLYTNHAQHIHMSMGTSISLVEMF